MNQQGRRVVTGLLHGGHAVVDGDPRMGAADSPLSTVRQDLDLAKLTRTDALVAAGTTSFRYLFKDLTHDSAKLLPAGDAATVERTVQALNDLGDAMIEQDPPAEPRNSPIPPIHTYWGQFVDHDLTAATDGDAVISIRDVPLPPIPPDDVEALLSNARHPALNLDSVYGDGPFAPPPAPDRVAVAYLADDPAKLRLGRLTEVPVGAPVPPAADLERDLPRDDRRVALIGDGRNDENLVVAQLHVAFLRFHNAAVDWVRTHEPERRGVGDVFLRARDLTRWTYQWLCVHDYLATVCRPGTVDEVLVDEDDLLDLAGRGTYMPLEFSVAAFRFGHSMVRGSYDWNRNFGRPGNTAPRATLADLFQFTGTGGFIFDAPTLPSNWPAEWARFVDPQDGFPDRFARPIDTHLAPTLDDMVNQVDPTDATITPDIATLLKHLARRNLLRGYRLSLPTGQAVAEALGIAPLTAAELTDGLDQRIVDALDAGKMLDRTPLWFYVLRESETAQNGDALGPVGSRIVAATIIGQIRHDPTSYLNQPGWTPAAGVRLPDGTAVTSIAAFLRFAGVL
jgi:hypothetical protein